MQTEDRETGSVKEQFKQKNKRLRAMHKISRMLMHKNNPMQQTQLRAVQTEGSMLMHMNNMMQMSHLLIIIQQSEVTSTIGTTA